MIMMKKILKILFFLSFLNSTIAAQKFNDLMMVLGNEVGNGAMTSVLAQAINDQAYPVLLSGQILLNYLEIAQKPANVAMAKQVKRTMFENNTKDVAFYDQVGLIKKTLPLIKKSFGEEAKNVEDEFKICFVKPLSNNDWYAYYSQRSNLVLLIPRYYIEQRVDKAITDPDAQVKLCGFDADATDLVRVSNITQTGLADILLHRKISVLNNIVDAIKSFFIKNTSSATEAPAWNIYLTGHGSAARIQTIVNKSFFVASSCTIAGMPFDDFVQLMQFFNNKIKTSFLYYASCFAGGRNRTLVNKFFNDLSINFMVGTEGSSELTVGISGLKSGNLFIHNQQVCINFREDYKKFFIRLREYFSTCENNHNHNHFDLAMRVIISNITTRNTVPSNNQPFVRVPNSTNFKPIPFDSLVKIITEQDLQECESKTIDVRKQKACLVYPSYVNVPLELGEETLIISGVEPELANQDFLGVSFEHQTVQFFEKIICENYLWKFISNLVSYNPLHNRIFLINELLAWDYDGTKLNDDNALTKVIVHVFALPRASKPYAGLISMDVIYKKTHLYHAEWEKDNFFEQLKTPYKTPELVLKFQENKTAHAIEEHVKKFEALAKSLKREHVS